MITRTMPAARRFDWIDQLMTEALRPAPLRPSTRVDAVKGDEGLTVTFELPGVADEAIEITAIGQVLTVNATRTRNGAAENISRSVTLHDSYDLDQIAANYANGLLTLTVPVKEAAKPRRITIATSPAPAIPTTAVLDAPDADAVEAAPTT